MLLLDGNDLQYCIKPLNGQVATYNMRVSSSVTSIVAYNMGWRGNVRPIQNPQVVGPAFGWGIRVQIRALHGGRLSPAHLHAEPDCNSHDNVETKTRKYKGVDAALLPDEDIIGEMKVATKDRMRVMQKSEGGKSRPVVVGGNELYRKMDFLSEIIEFGLRGSKTSTLFAGVTGGEDIDNYWISEGVYI